jgi:UDP-N-acetylglucosamine 2-epimerase (non-hydrolysing)
MEAGNRCFDQRVPEETNRRIIDHTADFNLVYSESARRNLLNEGIHPRSICLIGSPMTEVINVNLGKIKNSDILSRLNLVEGRYFLGSVHRQENTNKNDRIQQLFESFNLIASSYEIPVIVSTHPRTKDLLQKSGYDFSSGIRFLDPFNFYDYCKLQQKARAVLSDSGSLSEEASVLKFNAIMLRDSMERHEALETGSVVMSGLNFSAINEAISVTETSNSMPESPAEYKILDSSERTTRFIVSTLRRHNFWSGRR